MRRIDDDRTVVEGGGLWHILWRPVGRGMTIVSWLAVFVSLLSFWSNTPFTVCCGRSCGGGVDDALIFDFVGSECSKKIRMIDGTIVNQSSTVDII